jgi:hypothetical protein
VVLVAEERGWVSTLHCVADAVVEGVAAAVAVVEEVARAEGLAEPDVEGSLAVSLDGSMRERRLLVEAKSLVVFGEASVEEPW